MSPAELIRRTAEEASRMTLAAGGQADRAAAAILEGLTASALFPGARSADGALAGLWLFYGAWEESHRVAQDLDTAEGRYWHGILHRQEPDAWNANYWFRQAGFHPILPTLHEAAIQLADQHPEAGWPRRDSWSHAAFVDYCHQAAKQPGTARHALAHAVQEQEWRLLFAHCAAGSRS